MLRRLDEALAELCPPVDLGFGAEEPHFAMRARERGVRSIRGDLLKWAVERAFVLGRDDLIEPVFAVCPECTIYRVLLPEGPFYAVMRPAKARACTLYSHAEMRSVRRGRRARKHLTGRRGRDYSR